MSNPIDLEAERRRRAIVISEREGEADDAEFEAAVDYIIDAMVATQLSLPSTITATCVAMIDVLEISGHSRADAIKMVAQKIGLFRARKTK